MLNLFDCDVLPAEGDSAGWQRLVRRSAGVRPLLERAGWRCVKPYDGVDPSEMWVSPDGARSQVIVRHEPWRLPDELPLLGSAGWMELVARSHREREWMRHAPGWRCVRRAADDPIEVWRHTSGVEQRLALWLSSMSKPVDPGVPFAPVRLVERYRPSWTVDAEGERWIGAYDTGWN